MKKKEVTHDIYTFEFDGEDNWKKFMGEIGKQLDKEKIPLSDVAKMTWEHGTLTLYCIKVWTTNNGIVKRV